MVLSNGHGVSVIQALAAAVLSQHQRLAKELGDASDVCAERDALRRAVTERTREHTETCGELAEREIHTPCTWATRALGERPADPRLLTDWEEAIRQAARYRLKYDVSHPNDPLGAEPQPREQRRDWQRARETLDRGAHRLGRHLHEDHSLPIEIGE